MRPSMGFAHLSWARIVLIVGSAVVLIASVLLAGLLIGQRAMAPVSEAVEETPPQATPSPGGGDGETAGSGEAPEPNPEDFVEFRDEEAGFAIRHPEDWERRSSDDEEVRLLVTPNDRDSVLIRVTPIELEDVEEEITEEDVRALHGFTEQIVRDDEDVDVLIGPRVVQIADTVGTYYLYTFDANQGERGAHAHYFLFKPDRMITLVFQTIPPERFSEYADIFDVMANSFELLG